ncbi:MAG: hypothetical protein JW800_01495 [Candidatus Omnitrophica bacterium]|nr:hypothetical protein [Candidatus Omnitrophota bacterium]
MKITFRQALVLSVLLHIALVAPILRAQPAVCPKPRVDPITVDYIRVREAPAKAVESPKVDILPKVELLPSPPKVAAKSDADKADKDASRELAIKQAAVKSTKDYISYYQLIREKVRRGMKDSYRSYYGEGDVALVFVLASDGSLISSSVDGAASTPDQTLIDIAMQSLRQSVPFKPFPKALTLPQMSFTLTVSFKK